MNSNAYMPLMSICKVHNCSVVGDSFLGRYLVYRHTHGILHVYQGRWLVLNIPINFNYMIYLRYEPDAHIPWLYLIYTRYMKFKTLAITGHGFACILFCLQILWSNGLIPFCRAMERDWQWMGTTSPHKEHLIFWPLQVVDLHVFSLVCRFCILMVDLN